jgi:hypothetical protein
MLHADCTTVSRGGAPEPGDSASYIDVNISLSAPATYEPNLAASAPARSTDHRRSWVTADPDRNGRVGVVRGRYDVCVAWATREFEDRPRRLARCLFSRDTTAAHRSPPSTIRTMNHAACSSITNSNTHDSLGEPSAIQHPAHPRGKARGLKSCFSSCFFHVCRHQSPYRLHRWQLIWLGEITELSCFSPEVR